MKITNVTGIYPNYPQPLAGWRKELWQIVVCIETDTGFVGWGYGGGGQAALPIINGHFRELLLNATIDDTGDIAALWQKLYHASIPYGRKGVAIMALSGVDLAMWDVLGKSKGEPVYELLSGLRHEQIAAYATGQDSNWYAELGYLAHKIPHRWDPDMPAEAQYDALTRRIGDLRRMLGSDGTIMLDCYMTWDATVTREMAARLASFDILWFEDIITPDQLEEQAKLRKELKPIMIAGGEHEFTEHGFLPLAYSGALDIWQPDITWCGGMTAILRIVELARQYETIVIPHRGGEVWGLHLIAAGRCTALGEVLPGNRTDEWPSLWRGEPIPIQGMLTPSDAPGFGVEPNEALL